MTSQTGKQIIGTYKLPNISRRTGNQTTKFGQLREHNMRNVFLEELCKKWGGKTSPRPFFEKFTIEHISESIVLSFIQFLYFI